MSQLSSRLVALALPVAVLACGASRHEASPGADGGTETGKDSGSQETLDGAPGGDGAAAPTGALCTVATKGASGTLLSGTLLLPAGPSAGELLIDATGAITCAAASCASAAGYAAATHIACPSGVVSPSLINTHDHTEYATRAPDTLPTTRFKHRNDWRTGAEGATALPHVNNTADVPTIAAQELRFIVGGATSIVGTGGVGGLARNLADFTKPTYVEGLTGGTVFFDTFPLGDSSGVLVPTGCAYPKIEPASAAFGPGGAVFAPHIAEGINLSAENELTCASQASNQLITAQTSIIHGVGTNANDVNVIAKAGAKLIWSPRSNISLYGDTAPVTVYKALGVTIALGTDWLPSGSMNMLRELACADSLNQKYFGKVFSDQDLFDMVTKNAAIASGFTSQIGTLEAGKVADVTVFDGRASQGYRAVLDASVEDVRLVLRGGKVLYGDADVVAAFGATCTALDVCGASRSVCVDTPSLTLAQIQAAAASIYPLFFCRGTAPTSEPTCVPYRDTYASGTSATDRDGDGVADASDDCPDVFNPPRPMDNADAASLTKQADVDSDGVGDACDAKPLDPASH